MAVKKLVSGVVVAIVLAFTAGTVTALAQAAAPDREKAPGNKSTLATLKGVEAVPMAERELSTVKGLHIHLATPSQNAGHPLVEPFTGWHFVNFKENNLGKGQAPAGSGPGYSGLCGAALRSPALSIPFQDPVTGIGGGC